MSDATTDIEDGPTPARELEAAPLLLRKASLILIGGAILPWMTSISTLGNMPWKAWAIATALVLLGGFIMLEGAKAKSGRKAFGLADSIANAHALAPTIFGLVCFVAALAVAWTMGGTYFLNGELVAAGGEGVEETYRLRALLEIGTLFLAVATLAHIQAYEFYQTKFNPIFPLMFLGPAVAGALHVFTALTSESSLKIIGILGSLIVAAGGIMAMYTMYVSLKQAKVEGDLKKAAMREQRKADRAARRS
jgi:hypothetical protein